MNLQSIILLAFILVAFVAAIVYMVKNKSLGGCGGSSGCDGDCANCSRMRRQKNKDKII